MPLRVTPIVEVELSGAGSGWTAIATKDVVSVDGMTIRHGIQGSGPTDRVASTGTCSFTLRNDAKNAASLLGRYSLYHANKLTGWNVGIGCRVRIQDPNTSTFWTRFVGRIDTIEPIPGNLGPRQVRVMAVDWMDEAARWTLTPEIGEQVDKDIVEVLTAILAEMPRQPTATSFDAGQESYPFALDTSDNAKQYALAEFGKLTSSEFSFIYQKATGTLRHEGRHFRILDTTSDWTIAATDLVGLTMPSTREEIINTVRVTVHQKRVDTGPGTVVYSQTNVIPVAAGETKILMGPYRDPVTGDPIGATDVQTQVSGVDYTATDDGGADITSDFVVVVAAGASGARFTVTNNNAANGFLTTNRLLGRGVYDIGTQQLQASDPTSITTHGEHVVNFDMPYQGNDDVGQGAAIYMLGIYKDAFAQARTATVIADTNAILAQILTRDIGDRLTISETVTGLNNHFFINGIEMRVLPAGHLEATYILAPAKDPFGGNLWILGTDVLGTGTVPSPF